MAKNQKQIYYILGLLFIIFTTIVAYYSSLNYQFQFDDVSNITKFFHIRSYCFYDLFLSSTRWISSWLNTFLYKIGGFDPFYYRITNLIFHILTGSLIFLFTSLILRNSKNNKFIENYYKEISLLVTSLFLLHSVQTQTVSYIIQGQLEGLSSLFIMSVLLCFLLIKKSNSYLHYISIFLFSLLTIFSTGTKEIIIITPFLMILTDWFFVSSGNWQQLNKNLWLPALNLFLIIGSYIYIKPWFLIRMFQGNYICTNSPGNILTVNPSDTINSFPFFISQFKVLIHYLWIYIWPFHISVEYDWKLLNLDSLSFVIYFSLIISILGLIVYLVKKNKTNIFAFGFLWFFLVNAPRASFIPSAELVADYKTYLACYGWLLILSILIMMLLHKLKATKWFPVIFILITISLGFLTHQRNIVWSSGIEFWNNIIKNAPNKARGYNNYAVELSKQGKFNEAVPYYKRAILLEGRTYYDPYTNLAAAYAVLGDLDLAISTLQLSLKINAKQPEAYNNLGAFYLHLHDYENAQKNFEMALELSPFYGKAMYNLGKLNIAQNNIELAWQYFKKACYASDIDNELPPLVALAETSMQLNKTVETEFACKKIMQVAPNSQEAKIAKQVLNKI